MVIPELLAIYSNENISNFAFTFIDILINVGLISDAFIYIILIPRCKKSWKFIGWECSNEVEETKVITLTLIEMLICYKMLIHILLCTVRKRGITVYKFIHRHMDVSPNSFNLEKFERILSLKTTPIKYYNTKQPNVVK